MCASDVVIQRRVAFLVHIVSCPYPYVNEFLSCSVIKSLLVSVYNSRYYLQKIKRKQVNVIWEIPAASNMFSGNPFCTSNGILSFLVRSAQFVTGEKVVWENKLMNPKNARASHNCNSWLSFLTCPPSL